jgi:proteic killer suppression protein
LHTAGRSEEKTSNAASFDPLADDVFKRIAENYDFLCDAFSLYAHRLWKTRMARRIIKAPGRIAIDVASGTGDIPFRALRIQKARDNSRLDREYIISDLSPAMLEMESVDIYSISFAMKILDRSRVLSEAHRAARLRLQLAALDTAQSVEDMDIPGFKLHPLKGKSRGRWSIWVSGNWRLTFEFRGGNAYLIDYEDYH